MNALGEFLTQRCDAACSSQHPVDVRIGSPWHQCLEHCVGLAGGNAARAVAGRKSLVRELVAAYLKTRLTQGAKAGPTAPRRKLAALHSSRLPFPWLGSPALRVPTVEQIEKSLGSTPNEAKMDCDIKRIVIALGAAGAGAALGFAVKKGVGAGIGGVIGGVASLLYNPCEAEQAALQSPELIAAAMMAEAQASLPPGETLSQQQKQQIVQQAEQQAAAAQQQAQAASSGGSGPSNITKPKTNWWDVVSEPKSSLLDKIGLTLPQFSSSTISRVAPSTSFMRSAQKPVDQSKFLSAINSNSTNWSSLAKSTQQASAPASNASSYTAPSVNTNTSASVDLSAGLRF